MRYLLLTILVFFTVSAAAEVGRVVIIGSQAKITITGPQQPRITVVPGNPAGIVIRTPINALANIVTPGAQGPAGPAGPQGPAGSGGIASLSNYTYVRRPHFANMSAGWQEHRLDTMQAHGGLGQMLASHQQENAASFTNQSTQIQQRATLRQHAVFKSLTTESIKVNGNIYVQNGSYLYGNVISGGVAAIQYCQNPSLSGCVSQSVLLPHPTATDNPHSVTAAQVGAVATSTFAGYTGHKNRVDNPHRTTAAQVFDSHTGVRYPVFNADNSYTWKRPVELCGTDPSTAIFDGDRGPQGLKGSSITCHIQAPVQAFAYDTGGLNPYPPLQAFSVQLWDGIEEITSAILEYTWGTGGAGNTVYGSGSAATFTPSVKLVFNNSSTNNYVSVQARYSTTTGKGWCSDVASIAVTKPGAKGDKGDTGEATITKAGVVGQFTAGTAGGNAMLFFPSVEQGDGYLQIGIGDSGLNVRIRLLPNGMITILRPDGKYDFMYDPTTRKLRLGNYSSTSARSNFTVDHTGMMTGYKRSGTAIAYKLHSSLTLY